MIIVCRRLLFHAQAMGVEASLSSAAACLVALHSPLFLSLLFTQNVMPASLCDSLTGSD